VSVSQSGTNVSLGRNYRGAYPCIPLGMHPDRMQERVRRNIRYCRVNDELSVVILSVAKRNRRISDPSTSLRMTWKGLIRRQDLVENPLRQGSDLVLSIHAGSTC